MCKAKRRFSLSVLSGVFLLSIDDSHVSYNGKCNLPTLIPHQTGLTNTCLNELTVPNTTLFPFSVAH